MRKFLNIKLIVVAMILSMCFFAVSCKQAETAEEALPSSTPTPTKAATPEPTKAPETSMTQIQDRGYLVVACEPAAPPFVYIKKVDNEYTVMGAEFELASKIAENLGVELVIKNVKQSDILVGVETGLYDLGLSINELTLFEQGKVSLSQQYFINEYPVIINKMNVDKFKSLDDYKDKRIGVMRRTVEYQLVKSNSHKYAKVRQYETESKMIDNLMTDYLHAICLDAYKARYYLDKFPDLMYMEGVVLVPEDARGRAISVSRAKGDLLEYVDETIDGLTEDKFLLTKLGISVTDYAKNTIEIDNSCTDYVGILYGK